MLSDLESAMALVEGQKPQSISETKDQWMLALNEASNMLKWPDRFIVQYNPAIWRASRYTVGMRLLSDPFADHFIFEFSTPNYILPFDCFERQSAKAGVMLHEFSHLIDDERWGFDLGDLAEESDEFITREQRAELLAFACSPVDVFESNLALVESTARMLGIDLGAHSMALAAIETMGHAGLAGDTDPVEVFRRVQADGIPADKILEGYLCTFSFSLAGLTTAPEGNERLGLGIKRSKDLDRANEWLCRHLRGEMSLTNLEEMLDEVGYYAFLEEGYDPMSCLDLAYIDRKSARKNIERARAFFAGEEVFTDLQRAVDEMGARVK
jgi:hypothetical protein